MVEEHKKPLVNNVGFFIGEPKERFNFILWVCLSIQFTSLFVMLLLFLVDFINLFMGLLYVYRFLFLDQRFGVDIGIFVIEVLLINISISSADSIS